VLSVLVGLERQAGASSAVLRTHALVGPVLAVAATAGHVVVTRGLPPPARAIARGRRDPVGQLAELRAVRSAAAGREPLDG